MVYAYVMFKSVLDIIYKQMSRRMKEFYLALWGCHNSHTILSTFWGSLPKFDFKTN